MIDWIKCNDRLPEKSGEYLVCHRENDNGYRHCAFVHYNAEMWLWNWYSNSMDEYTDDDRDYNDSVEYWAHINMPAKKNPDSLYNAIRKSVDKIKAPAKLAEWAEDFAERTA